MTVRPILLLDFRLFPLFIDLPIAIEIVNAFR